MCMPKWYQKKPVAVEAMQLLDGQSLDCIYRWIHYHAPQDFGSSGHTEHGYWITVNTWDGQATARTGWWVVRGTAGEFYPVRPEVFEACYDPGSLA